MSKGITEILAKQKQLEAEYAKSVAELEQFKKERFATMGNLIRAVRKSAKIRIYFKTKDDESFKRKYYRDIDFSCESEYLGHYKDPSRVHITARTLGYPMENTLALIPLLPQNGFVGNHYAESKSIGISKNHDMLQDGDNFVIKNSLGEAVCIETSPMLNMMFYFRNKPFSPKHYNVLFYSKEFGETSHLKVYDIDYGRAFGAEDCIVVKANSFREACKKAVKKGLNIPSTTQNVVRIVHNNGDVQYRLFSGCTLRKEIAIQEPKIDYIDNMQDHILECRLSLLDTIANNERYALGLAEHFGIGLSQLWSEVQEGRISFFFREPFVGAAKLIRFPDGDFEKSEMYAKYCELIETYETLGKGAKQ